MKHGRSATDDDVSALRSEEALYHDCKQTKPYGVVKRVRNKARAEVRNVWAAPSAVWTAKKNRISNLVTGHYPFWDVPRTEGSSCPGEKPPGNGEGGDLYESKTLQNSKNREQS